MFYRLLFFIIKILNVFIKKNVMSSGTFSLLPSFRRFGMLRGQKADAESLELGSYIQDKLKLRRRRSRKAY